MNNQRYTHPFKNIFAGLIEWLCNNQTIKKIRRWIFRWLPYIKMKSEITDIVYVNWLVDLELASQYAPPNVELIDIQGKTLLSILTYKHGNLSPNLPNILRPLFPSPFQSNWRFYVSSFQNEQTSNTVLFIKNIISKIIYIIGTRIISDAMKAHYPKRLVHTIQDNKIYTQIDSGKGSCPTLIFKAHFSENHDIPEELIQYFETEQKLLEYLCFQDFALSEVDSASIICKSQINLPISIDDIQPLLIQFFESEWLEKITMGSEPFAFLIPDVQFELMQEKLLQT